MSQLKVNRIKFTELQHQLNIPLHRFYSYNKVCNNSAELKERLFDYKFGKSNNRSKLQRFRQYYEDRIKKDFSTRLQVDRNRNAFEALRDEFNNSFEFFFVQNSANINIADRMWKQFYNEFWKLKN